MPSRLPGPGQGQFAVRTAEELSAGLPGKARHRCKKAMVRRNLPPLSGHLCVLHDAGLVTVLLANCYSLLAGKLSVLLIMTIIISTSVELNCSALLQARHAQGWKVAGIIVPVKFFLPAFSAGRAKLKS